MNPNPGGVAGILLLLAVLGFLYLPGRWRSWRRQREARREREAHRTEDPPLPPATEEQRAALRERIPTFILPSAQLEVASDAAVRPDGTRIGGPAWLAEGEAWPCGREGQPMEFLAQLDFAELPPLADYPETGLLQFFIARDDLFGADLDDPAQSDVRLLWRPDPLSLGRLHPQAPLDDQDSSPFTDDRVRAGGRALRGSPSTMLPTPDSPLFEQALQDLGIEDAVDVSDLLESALEENEPDARFAGGHPRFVQWDFRKPGFRDDYDRVLLQLNSQHGLIWGDCGLAVFMIRRADLLARDFSRIAFTWDCS